MFAQGGRTLAAATVILASTLALLLAAAGCTTSAPTGPTGQSRSPSPSTTDPSPSTGAPVSLRFGISGMSSLREAYDKVARVYTNRHPEVSIELVVVEGGTSLVEEIREDAPDVFVATNEEAPELVQEGLVQPVDELLGERGVEFGDDYQRLGLEAFSADQALQCMPSDVSPLVVFYNPGLIQFGRLVGPGESRLTPQSGWAWEQFGRAARLMSRQGVTGTYVEPRLDTLMALARSAGADIVDDPRDVTTLTFADDATRSAVEEVLAVVRNPEITPTVEQLERLDGPRRFAQEKLGMIFGTRALVPQLRKWADFDFDVFPIPRLGRSRSIADVTGYCLSATTEHTEAATDFLAFAAGERGAAILADTGAMVPAHLPTLNSLAFTQPGEPPSSVRVFDESVRRSGVVPFTPHWPELRAAVEPDLERMFEDVVIDLDEILPRIDEQSRPILVPEESPAAE